MRKMSTYIALGTLILALPLSAETQQTAPAPKTSSPKKETTKTVTKNEIKPKPFTAFTGKITRNKVRLRLQPNLDGHILRELKKGDMLVVIGEQDDYYAVQPTQDQKAYIFRTFVLDNTVEGNHVNVRLEPDVDAPIVAQLNTGDRVDGKVSPQNSKWLEITPPSSARYYISKEYVERVGDASYMAKQQERQQAVTEKLAAATQRMQDALANSYDRIDQSSIEEGFNDIIRNYPDFDEETQRARVLLTDFNNAFIDKKIAFLEQRNNEALDAEALEQKNRKLTKAMQAQQARLAKLESQVKHTPPANQPTASSNKMTIWMPAEEQYYEEWAQGNPGATMNEYYDDLATFAGTYRGTIKPYNREVTNKPGDYILLNNNHTPVAYLYSTRVDLQDLIGQTVTIKAVPRPNNNFALKAYYVLSVEE